MLRFFVEIASTAGLLSPLDWRYLNAPHNDARLAADALTRIQAEAGEPVRHVHHERDIGIGYGNSSGYGFDYHYVSEWNPPRFRFV